DRVPFGIHAVARQPVTLHSRSGTPCPGKDVDMIELPRYGCGRRGKLAIRTDSALGVPPESSPIGPELPIPRFPIQQAIGTNSENLQIASLHGGSRRPESNDTPEGFPPPIPVRVPASVPHGVVRAANEIIGSIRAPRYGCRIRGHDTALVRTRILKSFLRPRMSDEIVARRVSTRNQYISVIPQPGDILTL